LHYFIEELSIQGDGMMKITVGVVMDPIESIHVKKDSTLALLLAAQQRHWKIVYMEQKDLLFRDGQAWAYQQPLSVFDNLNRWYKLGAKKLQRLNTLDVILMRKDPPVDTQYLYATQILDRAEKEGVLVINKPQSLRDVNEKLFMSEFPQCCAPTLVTSDYD
jgi:glutathione synthase